MKSGMKRHTRKRDSRERAARHLERLPFGILAPLTALVLVLALASSNGNAEAGLTTPGVGGEKRAAQPSPPAGERIAFSRGSGTTHIFAMDTNGGNLTQLTTGSDSDSQPDWSHDGSKIVFRRSSSAGTYSIWVMNWDGSDQHSIHTEAFVQFPRWSPNGTKIAFGNNYDIYAMNPDGSGVTALTTDHTTSWMPSWSPDGSKIAFVNEHRDGGQTYRIYVMNSDGSNAHQITSPTGGALDWEPDWSPDGSKIAFARGPLYLQIYTMNADGSNVTALPNAMGITPSWSPDGQQIAFTGSASSHEQIFIMNADGSNSHSISDGSTDDNIPDWYGPRSGVVLVQNEQGTPVPGAQVYRNSQGTGFPSTLVGTTNMSGTVSLTNPQQNDYLVARSLVYTGTTSKGSHDGWAYHVYLTDIEQRSDGSESAYQITDTSKITQTVTISRTAPLIGFNIVASVEYNATPDNLSQIASGFAGKGTANGFRLDAGANDYLLDVTDGQMFIEKLTLYEDMQNWGDADYQFFADYWRADAARNGLTGIFGHIHAQGSGDYGIPWTQTTAYSTLIHEFGHYAIGAYDEYRYLYDGDPSTCSLNRDPDYQKAASIMDDNSKTSEFCTQDNHNPHTFQGLLNGESVWQTLKRNWDDNQGRWTIQSPIERGFVDRGPLFFIAYQANETDSTIVPVPAGSCAPILGTVTSNGSPVAGAYVSLLHRGYSINESVTDNSGKVLLYGAETGNDTVEAFGPNISFVLHGSANISSCNAITVPLTIFLADADADQPDTQWPSYWLTATASFNQNQVHALLHFTADPPSQPTLYASQGGTNRQQMTLTYDPTGHNYTGSYTFDPSLSTDFQFEVGLSGAQGTELFPYHFDAAQFHTSGPEESTNDRESAPPPPSNWDIFPPETAVNLSVSSSNLADGTGVMGGVVNSPAEPPSGLLAVGGPYAVQAENAITGEVHLSLSFQSEYFCGLVAGSTKIYHFNGTGWDPLTTALNEEWHVADAPITQWGIYAVFAQPNPQVVFSDVPAGSTFYDYINWITCHSIASGYADGTFRPNNNATRGQISKMVANAYQWHLDPPSTGGYTFADVLPGSTFYLYIEAAYREGVVNGYPCGGTGEPCDADHRPYFRPNNNVTRGQIAKIISNGARYDDTPTGQSFQDVMPGSTFYTYTQRIASRSIINGYPCGGSGEPCVPPTNRPYFRPNNNATRGQLSKMIYLALQPR